jgi:pilus assembly protein CpaE
MRHPLRVLLVGEQSPPFSEVQALLAEHRQMLVTTRILGIGADPVLSEPQDACDSIVLVLTGNWRGTLERCFRKDGPAIKPLLVIGPADDVDLLRAVMRVGARDFFSLPVGSGDFIPALDRVAKEEHERRGGLSAQVTTCMNAKGGSGASFLAANFAHILVKARQKRTVLLDFELQFGSLPTYFNLWSRNGLIRALELVDSLDVTALQGYLQQHPSGLGLLAAASEGIVLPEDVHEDRVGKLFAVLDEAYEQLVVDLPRRVDRATAAVLDRSDLIMLVTQQTVAHLHDVKRLATLITDQLGIGPDRVIIIVNRFNKHGEVTLGDFKEALPGLRLETLPNDYKNVSKSINLGIPLFEMEPRAPLSRRILELINTLHAKPEDASSALWPWGSRGRR